MTPVLALPPCCTVRSVADARIALADGRPVTLLSAPGAASFGGAAVWIALVAALREEPGAGHFFDLLDCGDAPGRALEALRLGQRHLVFDGEERARDALQERASRLDAVIWPERPRSLDLAPYLRAPDEARRRVALWLDRHGSFRRP